MLTLSFDEMKTIINGMLTKSNLTKYIAAPEGKCEASALELDRLLKEYKVNHTNDILDVRFGGIQRIASEDMLSAQQKPNHYIVIVKSGDNEVYVDITAAQFDKSASPIISSGRDWRKTFCELDKNKFKSIAMQEAASFPAAKIFADSTVIEYNSTIQWLQVQNTMRKYMAFPANSFLETLKFDLTYQLQQLRNEVSKYPDREAKISPNQKFYSKMISDVETKILEMSGGVKDKKNIQYSPLKKDIIGKIEKMLGDKSQVISKLELYFNEVGPGKSDIRVKLLNLKEALFYLTLETVQNKKISSHDSKFKEIKTKIFSELIMENDKYAKDVDKNIIQIDRSHSGRLSASTNTVFDKLAGWETPTTKDIASNTFKEANPDGKYNKRIIIQLESDDISFAAAKNIFSKDVSISNWIQYKDNKLSNGYRWDVNSKKVVSGAMSAIPDADGKIHITLVGHGTKRDGQTLFAGKTAVELQKLLISLLPNSTTKIKGIHLDLVGCELADPKQSLEKTLPGQLATWLMTKGDSLGIRRDALTVSARQYPVRVIDGGKKEILTPEFGWITKETARLNDLLHKQVIGWDATTKELKNSGIPYAELVTASKDLNKEILNPNLAASTKDEFTKLEKLATEQLLGRLLSKQERLINADQQKMQAHVVEILQNRLKAKNWDEVVSGLRKAKPTLNNNWIALPETRSANKGVELRFVNKLDGASQWVAVEGGKARQACQDFNTLYVKLKNDLSEGFEFNQASKELQTRSGVPSGRGVNSLNAALLIQTLLGYDKGGANSSDSSNAFKVQLYTQLAQNSVGLVSDASTLVSNIKAALDAKLALLSPVAKLAQKMGDTATRLLNGVNIAAIAYELMQTKDQVERTRIEANLGLAVVSVGLDAVSFVTAFNKFAMSSAMGALGIPLTGLSVSLPTLVGNYARLGAGFDACANRFDEIWESIAEPGFQRRGKMWGTHSDAVVNSIDFALGKLLYGKVEVNATKGGNLHTVTRGWDHFFARPDPDTHTWLDVYDGLGLTKTQSFDSKTVDTVLLPSGVGRRYQFSYDQILAKRSASAIAFRKLHAHYGRQFIWGMYALPTDWGISQFDERRNSTPVTVTLDAKNRTLIVPTVLNKEDRNKLSYTLQGNGGVYSVKLPAEAVKITIAASRSAGERWLLDLDAAMKSRSIKDGKNELGALKSQVIEELTRQLTGLKSNPNEFTIGGQKISFQGNVAEKLTLTQSIGSGAVLLTSFNDSRLTPTFEIRLTEGFTQNAVYAIGEYFKDPAVKALCILTKNVSIFNGTGKNEFGKVSVSDANTTWEIGNEIGSTDDGQKFFQNPTTRVVTAVKKDGTAAIFNAPEEFNRVLPGSEIRFTGKSGVTYARKDEKTYIVNKDEKFIPLDADMTLFKTGDAHYFCKLNSGKIYYYNPSVASASSELQLIFASPISGPINIITGNNSSYSFTLNQIGMKLELSSGSCNVTEFNVSKYAAWKNKSAPKNIEELNAFLKEEIPALINNSKISIDKYFSIKPEFDSGIGKITQIEYLPDPKKLTFVSEYDVRFQFNEEKILMPISYRGTSIEDIKKLNGEVGLRALWYVPENERKKGQSPYRAYIVAGSGIARNRLLEVDFGNCVIANGHEKSPLFPASSGANNIADDDIINLMHELFKSSTKFVFHFGLGDLAEKNIKIVDTSIENGNMRVRDDAGLVYEQANGRVSVVGSFNEKSEFSPLPNGPVMLPSSTEFTVERISKVTNCDNKVLIVGESGLMYQVQNGRGSIVGNMINGKPIITTMPISIDIAGKDFKINMNNGKLQFFSINSNGEISVYGADLNSFNVGPYSPIYSIDKEQLFKNGNDSNKGARYVMRDNQFKLHDIDIGEFSDNLRRDNPDFATLMARYQISQLPKNVRPTAGDYVIARDSSDKDTSRWLKQQLVYNTQRLNSEFHISGDIIDIAFKVNADGISNEYILISSSLKVYNIAIKEIGTWQEGKIINNPIAESKLSLVSNIHGDKLIEAMSSLVARQSQSDGLLSKTTTPDMVKPTLAVSH